jgi:hypothetical protein
MLECTLEPCEPLDIMATFDLDVNRHRLAAEE